MMDHHHQVICQRFVPCEPLTPWAIITIIAASESSASSLSLEIAPC